MKKIFFNVTACMCAGLLFAGCNKDGEDDVVEGGSSAFDGVIRATNIVDAPSNAQVDEVKCHRYVDGGKTEVELASGKYENGGFTIKLPNPVPPQYLESLGEVFGSDLAKYVKTSDAFAKCIGVYGFKAYKGGERVEVGSFFICFSSSEDRLYYFYVDRDVSLTGSGTTENAKQYRWNVFLKRGWNKIYVRENEIAFEMTSTEPSGLKWYYVGTK